VNRFLRTGIALCVGVSPSPGLTAPPHDTSWGKAGVSLEQYARDATECADTSRTVAVSIKPETLKRLDALSSVQLLHLAMQIVSREGDPVAIVAAMSDTKSADDIARRSSTFQGRYISAARQDVVDELQAVLDKCLTDRGYVRIKLTDAQARALSHLKRHSPERTAYLHALDADPDIIAQQRLQPNGM
jgi:hypothetical protein